MTDSEIDKLITVAPSYKSFKEMRRDAFRQGVEWERKRLMDQFNLRVKGEGND